jgi:carbon-monoxide dehydrogenase medium subunit
MIFEKPNSEIEAVSILSNSSGFYKILGGGTDLLVQMRSGAIEPELVVDIKNIPGIREINEVDGGFEIGAAVSGSEFNNCIRLKEFAPGIAEAFDLIGSSQIQGRCTLAGNLCNASPAADTTPALSVSKCRVKIVGPNGLREDLACNIPISPGINSLEKGEFIKSIIIPKRSMYSSDSYIRFTPRSEMDIAVVSAACFITLDKEQIIKELNISLGAVAPSVVNIKGINNLINNSKLNDDLLSKISTICSNSCDPIDDKRGTVEFRSHVAGVLAKRAILLAHKRAGNKIEKIAH